MGCPICGSNEATETRKSNDIYGPGGRSWTTGYVCKGCSVMFKDKKKFYNKPLNSERKTGTPVNVPQKNKS